MNHRGVRVWIVEQAIAGGVTNAQVVKRFGMKMSTAASALQRLKVAGLITAGSEREGSSGAILWVATEAAKEWLALPRKKDGSVLEPRRPRKPGGRRPPSMRELADMPDLPDDPPPDAYGTGRIALEEVW